MTLSLEKESDFTFPNTEEIKTPVEVDGMWESAIFADDLEEVKIKIK